jgi:hypothetical protein
VPVHDVKVGVWCATNVRRIIGTILFDETINSERYVRLILTLFFFFDQLTKDEKTFLHFMQDNATVHTVNSMKVLAEVFGERVVRLGLFPACSPDLNSFQDNNFTVSTNIFSLCIQTFLQDVRPAQKQKVGTSRLYFELR